jgi:two-component system, LytTR family, sensor kinase
MAPSLGARWRSTLLLVCLFWATLYVALTINSFHMHSEPMFKALLRVAAVIFGALLCLGLSAILRLMARSPFWARAAAGAVLIFPAAMAYAVANALIFGWVDEKLAIRFGGAVIPAIVVNATFWVPSFLCWAGIFLALEFSFDVRDRERRILELRIAAERAQLTALRYQINPHFLFNAHNSVLSLIAKGEPEKAGATLLHLSDFLRTTLELDPVALVRLDDEIALTRLYLKIEQIRFPTRLRLAVEISTAAAAVMTPSLILQPLVENAVKHGVERSSGLTTITLRASVDGDRLRITILNDGDGASSTVPGLGVGLDNVRARLALIYGDAARLDAAPRLLQGYEVCLDVPLAPSDELSGRGA